MDEPAEDAQRDEPTAEEVSPACLDECLDAELWRRERDDGICTRYFCVSIAGLISAKRENQPG